MAKHETLHEVVARFIYDWKWYGHFPHSHDMEDLIIAFKAEEQENKIV